MQLRSAFALLVVGAFFVLDVSSKGTNFIRNSKKRDLHRRSVIESAAAPKVSKASNSTAFRYLTNKTESYRVTSLPDVHFDLGEFYSGSVPVDGPNRTLFFAFKPAINEQPDEVTIWLNGGPGCSSLEGFFQENGPWIWQPGTFLPVENPYTWANITNMLWVEQPVGTGFSKGKVTATSEEDIAEDFVKWFKNWQELFGIKNYKIYITGESYAGRYVPYISSAMLNQNNTEYYNLSGALIYDPVIGSDYAQFEVPTAPYVTTYNSFLNYNQSFLDSVNELDQSCGYAAYRDKWLTFPPPGQQPVTPEPDWNSACDIEDSTFYAALAVNPCYDVYSINEQCPLLWDVLSFPTALFYTPEGATTYFNRTDVKTAMHAPLDVDWAECSENEVFLNNEDSSPDSIQHAIPQVIEATNRFLIANGDYDMIIMTNGTLISIQNMTWNGKVGFQEAPSTPINITIPDLAWASVFDQPDNGLNGYDGAQGIMGVQHYERGLMWSQTYQSGHMEPEFQPRVTFRHIQWLLGRVDTL